MDVGEGVLSIVVPYIAYIAASSLFSSMCSGGAKYISAHGHNIPDLLEAVMKYFPLDTYNYSKQHSQLQIIAKI